MQTTSSTKELERLLKAVANKRRLAILGYPKTHHEATVGDIARQIKLSFKATSKHLLLLTGSDIVEKEQRSVQMFYKIVPQPKPIIKQLLQFL